MEKAFRFSHITAYGSKAESIVPFFKVRAISMKSSSEYKVYFGEHPESFIASSSLDKPEVQLGAYIRWVEES